MLININGKLALLPDFMIVGAPKCGTTSVYYYLKQHPRIFMPSEKEPYFFCFMDNPPHFKSRSNLGDKITKLDDYLRLFGGCPEAQTAGEATPAYLYAWRTSIGNIKKVYGPSFRSIKIIILLRNPAERAFSQYMMFRRDGFEDLDFEEAIDSKTVRQRLGDNWNFYYDYLGFGEYARQVASYMQEFEDVGVWLYEDFKNDNQRIMQEVYGFLGVDDEFLPDVGRKYNPSGMVRVQKLHEFLFLKRSPIKEFVKLFLPEEMRQKIKFGIMEKYVKKAEMQESMHSRLVRYYENDVKKLEKLLLRDLGLWK